MYVSLLSAWLLFSSLRLVASQTDFPPGLHSCYGPLCGTSFAFCSRESNVTIIPFRAAADTDKICVHTSSAPEWFCSDPFQDWSIIIPGCFSDGATVQVQQYNGEHWDEYKAQYLIRDIEDLPEYFHTSWIHIDRNAYGMLSLGRLYLQYKANPVAKMSGNTMQFAVYDGEVLTVPNHADHMDSETHAVEPGSWFFTVTPLPGDDATAGDDSVVRLANFGYIEFVLDKKDILSHRRFAVPLTAPDATSMTAVVDADGAYSGGILDGLLSSGRKSRKGRDKNVGSDISAISNRQTDAPLRICIWGSNKLDGQKSIWIQQIEQLVGSDFSFTWILTTNTSGAGTLKVLSHLQHPPQIVNSLFENLAIQMSDFDEIPDDASPPFSHFWDGKQESITKYIISRLDATATGILEEVSPRWVRDFLLGARTKIGAVGCNLMVYGSNRGFSNDALIVLMGRALNIPTVSELLNLFADPDNLPNAIIGPSHYAVFHDSIVGLLEPTSGVQVEVIPPGIDLQRFDMNMRFEAAMRWTHPGCTADEECIVVGFMARFSVEKNPGLFVMAAREIHEQYPSVCFVMIGDGELLPHIKDLVLLMGLEKVFYFPGWLIGKQLPAVLAGIDIMINPSLRAWSETFCIANIEAMAMGIPLITFAVGGVGEYVSAPERCASSASSNVQRPISPQWESFTCQGDMWGIDSIPGFEIGNNAIIINEASPQTIAHAVIYLLNNPNERGRIGRAGHETVAKYFSSERQMRQYSKIYNEIYSSYFGKTTDV